MPNQENWNNRWIKGDTPWSFEEANKPFYEDFNKVLSTLKESSKNKDNFKALVPLSGNSDAVKFLKEKNFNVSAVEFSQAAIDDLKTTLFSKESFSTLNNIHSTENLNIYKTDFLEFNPETKFDLIYDKAAFVAMEKKDREKYIQKLNQLSKTKGLLYISLFEWYENDDYGPPFNSPLVLVENMLSKFEKVFSKSTKQEEVSDKMRKAGINYYFYTHSLFKKKD